jgi:hypothetical protein
MQPTTFEQAVGENSQRLGWCSDTVWGPSIASEAKGFRSTSLVQADTSGPAPSKLTSPPADISQSSCACGIQAKVDFRNLRYQLSRSRIFAAFTYITLSPKTRRSVVLLPVHYLKLQFPGHYASYSKFAHVHLSRLRSYFVLICNAVQLHTMDWKMMPVCYMQVHASLKIGSIIIGGVGSRLKSFPLNTVCWYRVAHFWPGECFFGILSG